MQLHLIEAEAEESTGAEKLPPIAMESPQRSEDLQCKAGRKAIVLPKLGYKLFTCNIGDIFAKTCYIAMS